MLRGCASNICEQYYTKNENEIFSLGSFCYAPIFYTADNHKVLSPFRVDPLNGENTDFRIIDYSDKLGNHPPIKELNLRKDENYFVVRGKYRLVLILSVISIKKGEPLSFSGDDINIFLCAPLISVKDHYSQEYIIDVQAFRYPNLFYLPPKDYVMESFVRFELIQPVNKGCLRPFKAKVSLSDDAYIYLLTHLSRFLNNSFTDKDIQELINMYSSELISKFNG